MTGKEEWRKTEERERVNGKGGRIYRERRMEARYGRKGERRKLEWVEE